MTDEREDHKIPEDLKSTPEYAAFKKDFDQRWDEAAQNRLDALQAENARLREALSKLANAVTAQTNLHISFNHSKFPKTASIDWEVAAATGNAFDLLRDRRFDKFFPPRPLTAEEMREAACEVLDEEIDNAATMDHINACRGIRDRIAALSTTKEDGADG